MATYTSAAEMMAAWESRERTRGDLSDTHYVRSCGCGYYQVYERTQPYESQQPATDPMLLHECRAWILANV